MSVLVTKQAPNFKAAAVLPDNTFGEIELNDYKGKYVVLFFYPLDFTFVCPTEIIEFNRKLDEFKKRGVEVIGISVDSENSHFAWKNTPVNEGGIGDIQYPLVSDIKKSISKDYDVLFDESIALRGLFLIDKDGIVRHQVVNDLPLGRNVDEAIRVVDALQHVEKYGEVCPAGWNPGDDAMKPTNDGVADYLSKH
ncbi:peroxiredoxin [Thiospirochaeta perfilievii]|uniref:Thioredoxin peroxidase n=1 Tax=Thiospirochaeta perfilievii TaxID=252967 RepID=A0A5C1QDN6_9SPIO|nr:peroxiredoxin [Thiospirochaeta perfilievii]QEN06183.1 peroxiredoxin [Thiospirochaeta perfilievii]